MSMQTLDPTQNQILIQISTEKSTGIFTQNHVQASKQNPTCILTQDLRNHKLMQEKRPQKRNQEAMCQKTLQ